MTWVPLQEGFTWGEISPKFLSRRNSPVYQEGLYRCRNMAPTPQGNVAKRVGLEFMTEVEADYDGQGRIFPIDINADDRVIATMSNGFIKVFSDATFPRNTQAINNYSFNDLHQYWDYAGANGGYSYAVQAGDIPESIFSGPYWMRLTTEKGSTGDTPWVWVQQYQSASFPLVDPTLIFKVHANSETNTNHIEIRIGSTPGGTEFYSNSKVLANHEDWEIRQSLPALNGYEGDFYVRLYSTNNISAYIMSTVFVDQVGLWFDDLPETAPPPMAIPYLDDELDAVQYAQNPYVKSTVFVHPNHHPQELLFDPLVGWSFQEMAITPGGGSVEEPPWAEDVYDGSGGYPRAVGSYQGRVFFAATKAEPQAVWASRPGNWYDISRPGTPDATTPIWYTLTAIGAVQWMMGYKELLHGTVNGEHTIASGSGVVTTGDIQVIEQSRYGAAHIQAEIVGDEVFYVSGDRLAVRALNYRNEYDGWPSQEPTYTADHITETEISRLSFSKDPSQSLWLMLRGGEAAAMTYEPGQKILGWSRHSTDGTLIDVTEGRYEGVDYVYFLVRRTINSVQKLYIEIMRRDKNRAPVFLDCHVSQIFETPTTVITGLEHLEGKTVLAVGDNNAIVFDAQQVNAGQITLSEPVTAVAVGLPYTGMIETLPAQLTPDAGQSEGSIKNLSRIGVRLLDSSRPVVNGVRYPAKPDDDLLVVSGDYHMHHFGWDDQARVVVEQDLPLPLTITGIWGKLSDEDL